MSEDFRGVIFLAPHNYVPVVSDFYSPNCMYNLPRVYTYYIPEHYFNEIMAKLAKDNCQILAIIHYGAKIVTRIYEGTEYTPVVVKSRKEE